jgi:Holliday junction resolvase RusA-like endonuclease
VKWYKDMEKAYKMEKMASSDSGKLQVFSNKALDKPKRGSMVFSSGERKRTRPRRLKPSSLGLDPLEYNERGSRSGLKSGSEKNGEDGKILKGQVCPPLRTGELFSPVETLTKSPSPLQSRPSGLTFEVRGKPVQWRTGRTKKGWTFVPPDVRAYRSQIAIAAAAAIHRHGQWDKSRKIGLFLTVSYQDRKRRDLENLISVVQDALNDIAYLDDSQIDQLMAVRRPVTSPGRLYVSLWPLPE